MRLHITGASGSGTTTLGAVLSRELGYRHLDADDFYWMPTEPPFKEKRDPDARVDLLHAELYEQEDVVLSGSIGTWGRKVDDAFDLIVFLYLPAETRVERLRKRETERYGSADPKFLEWASQYDEGSSEGRSLAKHNAWLARRTCPVLRLESNDTVNERLAQVRNAIFEFSRTSAA
jgi:adenylate kinase family enzyme